MNHEIQSKYDKLVRAIRTYESTAVAFSGGVDSTLVARAAVDALGVNAVAVTAASESLAPDEFDDCQQLAAHIGIRHEIVETREMDNPDYAANPANRCYFCKTELYERLETWIVQQGIATMCDGANVDDQGDYRPGLEAASEHEVRHPLWEAEFSKADIRAVAKELDLPNWDKPAAACLSSRVAYGQAVTPEKLSAIAAAESYLRSEGFRQLRVRHHEPAMARIEVPADDLSRWADAVLRARVVARLKEIGFTYVTLDLAGFRSGSSNEALPVLTPTDLGPEGRQEIAPAVRPGNDAT